MKYLKTTEIPLIHLASLACLCVARCPQGTYMEPHKGCLSCRSICHDPSSEQCLFHCGTDWKDPPDSLVNHTDTPLHGIRTLEMTLKPTISETIQEVQIRNYAPNGMTTTPTTRISRKRNKWKNQDNEMHVVKSKINPGAIFVILLISVPTVSCAIYVFIGYCCCQDNRKSMNTDDDSEIIPMQPQNIIMQQLCYPITNISLTSKPITSPTDDV